MLLYWLPVVATWATAAAWEGEGRCQLPTALYYNDTVSRVISIDNKRKILCLVWTTAPSGAAGALLVQVMRALGYRDVTLDHRASAALCTLERDQRQDERCVYVVPAADSSEAPCAVQPRVLAGASRAAAPLHVALYMRLAMAVRTDRACALLLPWNATPDLLVHCKFTNASSASIIIYTVTEMGVSEYLSEVFESAWAAGLNATLTPISRSRLHELVAHPPHSFLLLDYQLWEPHEAEPVALPARGHLPRRVLHTELLLHRDLEHWAPSLYRTVQEFDPTVQDFRAVLETADRRCADSLRPDSQCLEDAACDWLTRHPARLQFWSRFNIDTVNILILECNNNSEYAQVFDYATELLKKMSDLKIKIEFKHKLIDCSSSNDDSARVIDYEKQMSDIIRCIGVVTEASSAPHADRLTQLSLALPFVHYKMAASTQYQSRSFACSVRDFVAAVKHFLEGMGWRRIAVISEQTKLAETIAIALKSSGTFIIKDIKLTKNLTEALNTLVQFDGRIVIVNGDERVSEEVIHAAQVLGVAGAGAGAGADRAWLLRSAGRHLRPSFPVFHLRCGCREAEDKFGVPDAASLLDAILSLANGFRDSVQKDPVVLMNPTGRNITQYWLNVDKLNYSSYCRTKQDEKTSLSTTVLIDKLYNNETIQLGTLNVRSDESVYSEPSQLKPYEAGERVPHDGHSSCTTPLGDPFQPHCMDATCAVAGLLLALAVLLALGAHRRRATRRAAAGTPRVAPELTRFLLDREHLQTYDILGTGRFGRVHLGVLRAPGKAPRPVAVKSLRSCAAPAEETEFLNEAVILAGLNHEHVVRFVGACVSKGPPLVLMEHAFFGDLRRYLHERRHLVEDTDLLSGDSQDLEEAEHVSSAALTGLAAQAALALQYLARRGIVHRDVRASNCLVDTRRQLKLGDFGMARRTLATGADGEELYACRRRGLFPVLWMAPESLSRGAFSAASDVWSLGVLMLETVTLGARPYGAWSPVRVLQHVAGGGRPELPLSASAEARGLTSACWRRAAHERPSAAEVARYLREHPRALRPAPLLPGPTRRSADADSGWGSSDSPSPQSPTRPMFPSLDRLDSKDLSKTT